MLTRLSIRNIALIQAVEVECAGGFTALTGETGAGKSMLLDALSLALGARTDGSLIRAGETVAEASAGFTMVEIPPALQTLLDEQGIEAETENGTAHFLLRRQLKTGENGGVSSKAWLNGTPVTLATLAAAGAELLDLHAQHATSALQNPAAQRRLIDDLGTPPKVLEAAKTAYATWKAASTALENFETDLAKASAQAELHTLWLNDLTALAYTPGEEETLESQRNRSKHAVQLAQQLNTATHALDDAAMGALAQAARALQSAAGLDETLLPLAERLQALHTEAADISYDLSRHQAADESERSLEEIENRLHAIKGAARRHGVAMAELPAVLANLQTLTGNAENAEARRAELKAAETAAGKALAAACTALTAAREATIKRITPQLSAMLKSLHMPNAQVQVALNPTQPGPHGAENLQILLSANPGQPLQGIEKIASGGELSRLMLALKTVLYQGLSPRTVVLDESDTGLGGAAASSIGAALATLAQHHQVITITHHPQVAAYAGQHVRIAKTQEAGTTQTSLTVLDDTGRETELARMLSGATLTDAARSAAKALLAEAQNSSQKRHAA